MKTKTMLVLVLGLVVGMSVSAQAQFDPFLWLTHGVIPECPHPGDPITVKIDGELPSTAWSVPVVDSVLRDLNTFTIHATVTYDPNPTLPVTVPFSLEIPLGGLPAGLYTVDYIIQVDNPILTMPSIPLILATDSFRVYEADDLSCGGLWPFLWLRHRITPDCPFDCDTVVAEVDGELPSTSWNIPVVDSVVRGDNTFGVYLTVTSNGGNTLPVTVPFSLDIPFGPLPEGAYKVSYTMTVDNPLMTMPTIPRLWAEDSFRVAPPGDQNCDGVVNIIDIVHLIGPIFRNSVIATTSRRADVNCDGALTVLDIVRLIVYVFRNGDICDPCDGITAVPFVEITFEPPGQIKRDSYDLMDAGITGDILSITLAHSGGCMDHDFNLFMIPPFAESTPVQAALYPQHIDPGDPCDAWVTETLQYNVRPIAELYELLYGQLDDIQLNVHSYDQQSTITVLYSP